MTTLSANGSTEWVPVKGPTHLHLSGNFGGGTATLEFKDSSDTARAIANGAFSTATDKLVSLGFNTEVRVTLSGATSPSLIVEILSHAP